MLIWLVAFTLSFIVLGANSDESQTYVDVGQFFGYFLLIWENSIGNINPPTYAFWLTQLDAKSHLKIGAKLVIYFTWFIWFGNQMLILIILLNFLIAVVSQSYENVMNSAMRFKYQQRCSLMRDAAIIISGLGRLTSYTALILQADHSDNGGNGEDWAGFVQTLKSFIRTQNSSVINKFNKAIDATN